MLEARTPIKLGRQALIGSLAAAALIIGPLISLATETTAQAASESVPALQWSGAVPTCIGANGTAFEEGFHLGFYNSRHVSAGSMIVTDAAWYRTGTWKSNPQENRCYEYGIVIGWNDQLTASY